jgi:hypothetical protein
MRIKINPPISLIHVTIHDMTSQVLFNLIFMIELRVYRSLKLEKTVINENLKRTLH